MTKHYTTIADLAERMGNDISDYGTFPAGHQVVIHDNGQALTLDGGIAVDLEGDSAKVCEAYAAELAGIEIGTEVTTNDDTGRVLALGGDGTEPPHPMNKPGFAFVGWDSGVATWTPVSALTEA